MTLQTTVPDVSVEYVIISWDVLVKLNISSLH